MEVNEGAGMSGGPLSQASDPGDTSKATMPMEKPVLPCPRCNSINTKFAHYNNYQTTRWSRYCRDCGRKWTVGGKVLRGEYKKRGSTQNKRPQEGLSDMENKPCKTSTTKTASVETGRLGQVLVPLALPLAIYHPLHIGDVKKVLTSICLVCGRFKQHKEQQVVKIRTIAQNNIRIHLNEDRTGDSRNEAHESSSNEGCKYCGVNVKNHEHRYPTLVVSWSTINDTPYETIELIALAPADKMPKDYWWFLWPHTGFPMNFRPLLPFEARKILNALFEEATPQQLDVIPPVALPESLVISIIPPPPSETLIEVNAESSVQTVLDDQYKQFLRLIGESERIRRNVTECGDFKLLYNNVIEIQNLGSDYLAEYPNTSSIPAGSERVKKTAGGGSTSKKVENPKQDGKWEKQKQLLRNVRHILLEKYEAGEILNGEDRELILKKVLQYHLKYDQKVGCGMKDIKVDYHPVHEKLCFYVIRFDGTECKFSYRKGLLGHIPH